MSFGSHSVRRRRSRRSPLAVEALERRTLPAGNVTAATLGDAVRLTGDAADNAIKVLQLGPDQDRITGVNGTTVDGEPEVVEGPEGPFHRLGRRPGRCRVYGGGAGRAASRTARRSPSARPTSAAT